MQSRKREMLFVVGEQLDYPMSWISWATSNEREIALGYIGCSKVMPPICFYGNYNKYKKNNNTV